MRLVVDKISYFANLYQEKIAIFDFGHDIGITFGQLNAFIEKASDFIASKVAKPKGQRIAILSRNNIEQLAFMYAAIRLEAVFVPINWRLTEHEIELLLDDCKPSLILSQSEFSNLLSCKYELLESFIEENIAPSLNAAPEVDEDNLAIILYTSGTTGRPKGVMISLKNALASSENFRMVTELDESSVSLCDSPLFHTMGLIAICRSTLQVGGKVMLSPAFNASDTIKRIGDKANNISHYFCVPQMTVFIRQDATFNAEKFKNLKALFVGGAPLSKELAKRWMDDGIKIINGYGTSETGTAIHNRIDDLRGLNERAYSVGTPAPLIEISIRDTNGCEVDKGVAGEIWMRGPNVSSGYWCNENATKAAFSGDWYKSGDCAYIDDLGYYVITDRLKDMYISGGENVYPAEVEGVIADIDGIKEVAIIGVHDDKWGEVGAAFIVKSGNIKLSEAAIFEICRNMLAAYKIPKKIIFVDFLPRTASGKVQKQILKEYIKN